jgi:hypothetical protein
MVALRSLLYLRSIFSVTTAVCLMAGAALSAADLVAEPFALSAVNLTGDWADAQRRNREVLLSLNMTSWSCQFTNTANLTSCASDNCISPGRVGMPSCIPLPGEMSLVRPEPFILTPPLSLSG